MTNLPRSKTANIAAIAWLMQVIYFPVQLITASAWPQSYSWKNNYISSLGNTACGPYEGLYVCSPLHLLMNMTYIIIGLAALIGGALFAYAARNKSAKLGFGCLALGGVGTIVVGLVPENVNLDLHSLGAFLPFALGNIGLIVLGSVKLFSKKFRIYTLVSGLTGVAAFALFSSNIYLGLGAGGMERIIDYTQLIWMVVFAACVTTKTRIFNHLQ